MSKISKKIKCPTCGKKETWSIENKFRPFCSERCRLIDLGEWADEKYRVTGEKTNLEKSSDQNEDKE